MDPNHNITDESHSERTTRILTKNMGLNLEDGTITIKQINLAEQQATAEMLDDIHAMLRLLLSV